jgi:16S rRNA (cytidine1402-2'-O)-methyltransferase
LPTGKIYLVPVPIGNLGDITLRALDLIKSAEVIAAEDTRKTRSLLQHYQIPAPRLLSLHKYNEKQRLTEIISTLKSGVDVYVVTDAGSPGISDPSMLLIQHAIQENIIVVPLPGATALIPALTASGLDTNCFQFLGFLPRKPKDRKIMLKRIASYPGTSILYEAPHRLRETLEYLFNDCGKRKICLAREISKLYEEFIRGDLETILNTYSIREQGEFVIVLGAAEQHTQPSEPDIIAYIKNTYPERTQSLKSIASDIALHFGISKNKAYQLALQCKGDRQ